MMSFFVSKSLEGVIDEEDLNYDLENPFAIALLYNGIHFEIDRIELEMGTKISFFAKKENLKDVHELFNKKEKKVCEVMLSNKCLFNFNVMQTNIKSIKKVSNYLLEIIIDINKEINHDPNNK